jgi:phage-related protein
LRGKLFELRIPAGKRDYRVLYCAAAGRRFILLHVFSKQTDKTSTREIAIAERRMAEYLADPERDEP